MNIDQLTSIYQTAKNLKCAIIVISSGKIMGTDETLSIYREMEIQDLSIDLAYEEKKMKELLDYCTEHMLEYKDMEIPDDIQYLDLGGNKYYIRIPFYKGKLIQSSMNIQERVSNSPVFVNNDIRTDPEFERITEFKAGDGVYFYRTNGYVLALYKTLLSITKKDKIALEIYPIYRYEEEKKGYVEYAFIAKFLADKGKGCIITHYILYSKLD